MAHITYMCTHTRDKNTRTCILHIPHVHMCNKNSTYHVYKHSGKNIAYHVYKHLSSIYKHTRVKNTTCYVYTHTRDENTSNHVHIKKNGKSCVQCFARKRMVRKNSEKLHTFAACAPLVFCFDPLVDSIHQTKWYTLYCLFLCMCESLCKMLIYIYSLYSCS